MALSEDTGRIQPPLLKAPALAWLVVLMAFGLYVRVPYDLFYGYNMDEAIHVNIASGHSLAEVLRFSRYEGHPPLLYVLVHYWQMISPNPIFVRCLPLLLGMLLIPLYYLIGERVGGALCGVCCAAFITLSHACIFQSFVVRQYCAFMMFIGLCHYCFLCWRESHARSLLLWYVLFGWLAALSHFSAVFYFICVTLYGPAELLFKKAEKRVLVQWLLANMAVLVFAFFLYHLWQPIITARRYYFLTVFPHPATLQQLIAVMMSSPFVVSGYIYPTFPILPALFVYAFLPGFSSDGRRALRPYIALAALACLLRMVLYVTWAYPSMSGRHNLWMLPFIIPAAAGMVTDLLDSARKKPESHGIYIRAITVLAGFAAFFAYGERFSGPTGEERNWSWSQYQIGEVGKAIATYSSHDLIDMGKFNAGLYINPYFQMDDEDAFSGKKMAEVARRGNTRILFNPYFPNDYSAGVMLATLRDAEAKHMLDSIDRLVFITDMGRAPVIDMALCDRLKKKMTTIPPLRPLPPGHVLVRRDLRGKVVILEVSKQAVLNDVLAPAGKARACLDGKNDSVPGLEPMGLMNKKP